MEFLAVVDSVVGGLLTLSVGNVESRSAVGCANMMVSALYWK